MKQQQRSTLITAVKNQQEIHKKLSLKSKAISALKSFFQNSWFIWLVAFLYFFGPMIYRNYLTVLKILAISVIVGLCSWIAYKLFFYFFGCKLCHSSGFIDGSNNMLSINFEEDECYACGGMRFVFPANNEWYEIALNADQQMQRHFKQGQELESQIANYKASMKISSNVKDDYICQRFQAQINSLQEQLKLEQSHCELYRIVKIQAHTIMHKKHLMHLQDKWERLISENNKGNIEKYSRTISTGEDVRISSLFDPEVDSLSNYLDSVIEFEHTSDLMADVKKATEKLKREFALT